MVVALGIGTALIAAVFVYKLVLVLEHTRWFVRNGPAYRRELDKLRSSPTVATISDIDRVLRMSHLNGHKATPFGINEISALVRVEKLLFGTRRERRWGRILQTIVFIQDYSIVASLSGIVLVGDGLEMHHSGESSLWVLIPGFALTGLLLLSVLILGIESLVGYARLGSYGLAYQDPVRYANPGTANRFLRELSFLGLLITGGVYVDATCISFLANSQHATFGVRDLVGPSGLFNDAFHAFMTFIFSSLLAPSGTLAELFVGVVSCQGVLIVILAVAAFGSSTKAGEEV